MTEQEARRALIERIADSLDSDRLKERLWKLYCAGDEGIPMAGLKPDDDPEAANSRRDFSLVRTGCDEFFANNPPTAFDIPFANKSGPRRAYRLRWKESEFTLAHFPDDTSVLSGPTTAPSDSLDRQSEAITPFSACRGRRNLASIAGFLGGEVPMCAAVSLSYGVMMGVSLPMEVAYRWSDFKNWVVPASVIIGACSAAVAITTFELIRRRAAVGRFNSLGRASGILSVWSLAIGFLVAAWLPTEPIAMAYVGTMPARVGWLKSVLEALGLPILALVPVQAVFALRYLIDSDNWQIVGDILRRNSGLAGVRGAFVPGAWPSFAAFAVVTLWRINVDGHLIENLKDGPCRGLFVEFLITRSGVGCIMLFTVLLWYLLRMNRFEHEVRCDQLVPKGRLGR